MTERTVKVTVAAYVNGYLSAMDQVEKATNKNRSAAEKAAAEYERQNTAMRDMGTRLAAVGAVAVAATGLAVKAAIDWETAWAGVTKTVDGSVSEMAELEGELRTLATTLPATHQEIAAVAEAAGQLGVRREDVSAFTKVMVDLGETTNLSADEAATSIAQLMNVMQTAPDQVDNLGAALVALGNDGASTERDIVQMAQRIAGAGRVVGLTEGEVLGFANALASVGIEAEAGGSAVSRIMTDIAMSVSAGGEELDRFAAVAGVSSKDFQKAFKDDPADAIATFVEGLGRIDAEGGDVFKTLADLGQSDIRVSQALLGMANSGDLLRKSLNLGNTALKENTALSEEAEKRYETTASKLRVVGNQINDAAIDFGTVFLPAVTAVAEAVGALTVGFTNLSDPAQTLIAILGSAAALATLGGGIFLLAIPKIAEFRLALATLSTSTIPAVSAAAVGAQTAIGKVGTAASGAARFLMGPWGVALAAAAVGVLVLEKAMESLRASSEEMQNSLTTAKDGLDILMTAAPSGFTLVGDIKEQFDDLDKTLRELDEFKNRPWWQPSTAGVGLAGADDALSRIGKELATLASSDLPAAQSAFQELAGETDGSDESLQRLLSSLGPEFRDALIAAASAQDINISAMTEAEKQQALLNLATEQAPAQANEAAEAYKAEANAAKSLNEELTELIDAVNAANSTNQDAISANASYQAAIAGISDEVQRQRDEYEELNGTLDGFALSLDRNTAAGSANEEMLSGVAKAAQDAALAQLEVDSATLGADQATQNYLSTIAAQRQAFIDSATEAGFNADEVQALADKVFALPDAKAVQIIAETAAAQSNVDRFITTNSGRQIPLKFTADGLSSITFPNGMVATSRANGGILPGPPSSKDNILVHAATGEFITNAAATQRNRAALEYINNGGVIRGFANGGFVQPQYASSGGSSATHRSITIAPVIHAAPGMDENALVRKAVRAVEELLK